MTAVLRVPPLSGRQVQLWWADPGASSAADIDLLDQSERHRRELLRRDDDRRRFVTAAALLRRVAGVHARILPHRLRVDRRCADCGRPHGKPQLPDCDLHVSLSHSGDRVLLAVTRLAPVGVDVERIVAGDDLDAVSSSMLAAGEPLPDDPAPRLQAFFRYWTRKEAVVKATGTGLREPLNRVVVSPHDRPARLVGWESIDPRDVCLIDVDAADGYRAAMSVLAAGPIEPTVHDAATIRGTCQIA